MMRQFNSLGIEKTTPDNTDIIPIQQADGVTRHITRANFLSGISSSSPLQYIQIADVKTDNSHGGGATSGSWLARDLNTIIFSDIAGVTIPSNAFVLPAGNYIIDAQIPFEVTGRTRCRLRNITDSTDILYSSSEYFLTGTGSTGHCFIKGKFTIGASKSLQIQYRCNTSQATYGLGNATGFGNPELYTIVELFKVS